MLSQINKLLYNIYKMKNTEDNIMDTVINGSLAANPDEVNKTILKIKNDYDKAKQSDNIRSDIIKILEDSII